MDKVVAAAAQAVGVVRSGGMVAAGGFGVCGIPAVLLAALSETGVSELTVVSNNCGIEGIGTSLLLENRQVRRLIASYVGENKELERQYLAGEVEIELNPQGTLAERLRAGGAGIAAFYTRTGVGTVVAEGGMPIRYASDGSVAVASEPKPTRLLPWDGEEHLFVLELALRPDVAFVRAWRGDRFGNLVFRQAARNFNPLCAMAARYTVAEVEEFVEPGELDPDAIHLPGVFVDAVLPLTREQAGDKPIERRIVRPRPDRAGGIRDREPRSTVGVAS